MRSPEAEPSSGPKLLPHSQCDAVPALRFWRAWWIVLDGFGLTLAALVVPFGGLTYS